MNEDEADIASDEDSAATDMEPSALPESFDAAVDGNEQVADITPDEDSAATDVEPIATVSGNAKILASFRRLLDKSESSVAKSWAVEARFSRYGLSCFLRLWSVVM